MDAVLFSLNAVLPIILTVLVGYILKRIGLIDIKTAKTLNKIVFRVFLPTLLFLNVYEVESFAEIDFSFVWYAVLGTLAVFLLSIPVVMTLIRENPRRGVTVQAIFRSNYAFVGIPLAESLFGAEGALVATLLSAIIIPIFNILAVIILTAFGSKESFSIKRVLLGIAKNPLIIAIFAGLACFGVRAIFVKYGVEFRLSDITPVYSTLSSLSKVATPLALVVLGAEFEFSAIKELRRPLILGVTLRSAVVPALALSVAYFMGIFQGAHFAAFIAVFATPCATSTVPMAQELGGDSALAGQFVVFTTVAWAFTVFIASMVLKLIGVFP